MKRAKAGRRPRLVLLSEQIRVIQGGIRSAPVDAEFTSQISNRSTCEGTKFCCKPP